MPPKHKKHSATYDKRNEGLAAPGKKIVKQRSNGHLNGSSNGKVAASILPAASEVVVGARSTRAFSGTAHDPDDLLFQPSEAMSRQAWTAAAIQDHTEPSSHDTSISDIPAEEDLALLRSRADTMDSNPDSAPAGSAFGAATTVIGRHPLSDVVAILLLLFQLPPTLVTLVQFCFAFLTFGGFSNGWNLSSFSSTADWLHGRGGNPSIVTIVIADVFFLFLWFMNPWGKEFILDIAQAVIAVSLGGGAASQSDWTLSTAGACLSIIGCRHLFRHESPRKYGASLFWTLLSRANLDISAFPMSLPNLAKSAHAGHTWPRALLELHIITQGIVRVIRRYFTANSTTAVAPKIKRGDAEITSPSTNTTITADNAADGSRTTSSDGRPPGPSPAGREGKEKSVSSGKKRRKQATFVRSQQPFWAAIANTKVTVSKEMEQSHGSRDSYESGASSIADLGVDGKNILDGRIWIVNVDETSVGFKGSLPKSQSTNKDLGVAAGDTECQHPFNYIAVCVNGADWSSTNLGTDGAREDEHLVEGNIFGLTPLTNYLLEFYKAADGTLLYSTVILTRPVASADPASGPAAPPHQSMRPSSPTTTLKQSIAAAETKLNDAKNRSKKFRRDHQKSAQALQKEVTSLGDRLDSFGPLDSRQRQREMQFRNNIRQAEEAASAIVAEIEVMGPIPAADQQAYSEKKRQWQKACDRRLSLRQELDDAKAEGDRQSNAARAENASIQQKREKLEARLQKLDAQKDGLIFSNAQSREERDKHDVERSRMLSQRQLRERNLLESVLLMEAQARDAELQVSQLEQPPQSADTIFPQPYMGVHGVPRTPESSYANLATGGRGPSNLNPLGATQYPVGTPPVTSRRGSVTTRQRKSSMLSDASGFTDDATANATGNEYHDSFAAGDVMATRNNSDGSEALADKSLSRNGSQRDPRSPPAKLTPIGAEIGRSSPRNGSAM